MRSRQNYNTRDRDGLTPIFYAVLQDDTETVDALLQHGANINAKNKDGETPIMWACAFGNEDMAGLLINEGADLRARDKNNSTVLSWACIGGVPNVVRFLLQYDFDADHRDRKGNTPLLLACHGHHLDVVQLLVEEGGADINRPGGDQMTPLLSSCAHGHKDICELLLYYGADYERPDGQGRTPLMWACRSATGAGIAMMLLEVGANPRAEDFQGHRAIDYLTPLAAKHGGRLKVLQRALMMQMHAVQEGRQEIYDVLEFGNAVADQGTDLIGPNVRVLDMENAGDRRTIARGKWFYDATDVRRDGSLIRAFEADVLAGMAQAGAEARNPWSGTQWPLEDQRRLRRVLKKLRV